MRIVIQIGSRRCQACGDKSGKYRLCSVCWDVERHMQEVRHADEEEGRKARLRLGG